MLKLSSLILALFYGLGVFLFSNWRLKKELNQQSSELKEQWAEDIKVKFASALNVDAIKVHIYEIEPINGLAASDGRIFLTRGFINQYKIGQVTAYELASVIAHELGHVALGHSKRRMIHFSVQNALRIGLSIALSRIIPRLGGYIAHFIASLFAAGLSRKDEYEADAYASALMIKAGFGTEPQKTLFKKLDSLTYSGSETGQIGWMMSHPKTSDRIQAIEANEVKWGLR